MSNKKIEVSTVDGDSAVLDLALTKTTTHVVVAAGLGLLGGLLVSRVNATDDTTANKIKMELDALRAELAGLEKEDGIHQADVDAAIAAGEARARELLEQINNLQNELGSRPTKAELDAANTRLTAISRQMQAEVESAYAQVTALRNSLTSKDLEVTSLRADLLACQSSKGNNSELELAITDLLSVLSNSVGITSSNSVTLEERVLEAKENALALRPVDPSQYSDLDNKASELAGLPRGDSILGHSDPADTYNKLREILLLGAKAKDVNTPYEEDSVFSALNNAGNIFDLSRVLDAKKHRIGAVASYWWMEASLSYGVAFLNAIMDVIARGKKGDTFGDKLAIAIPFHDVDDEGNKPVMFRYAAANGVQYTEHYMRGYFTSLKAVGRIKLEGNSINQEFNLSINGLTLLEILKMLESPSYLYEGGHVRISEGFLYRDYQAREALAGAIEILGDHIEGISITRSANNKMLTDDDINFIKELLRVKELEDAVAVRFFL